MFPYFLYDAIPNLRKSGKVGVWEKMHVFAF